MSGILLVVVRQGDDNRFYLGMVRGIEVIGTRCPWMVRMILESNRDLTNTDRIAVVRHVVGEAIARKLDRVPDLRSGIWRVSLRDHERFARRQMSQRRVYRITG